jgi:quinoprotein glucose dehydrogenase
VTASGLVFIGSTTDQQFRAFDSGTGKELWSATLPNDAIATPLTYMGRNGKQYVATVAGGGLDNFVKPRLETPRPNVIVAFKLP